MAVLIILNSKCYFCFKKKLSEYRVMMKTGSFLEQAQLFSNILAFSVPGSSLQCCVNVNLRVPPLLTVTVSHNSLFKTSFLAGFLS